MSGLALILILVAAFLHASWNLLAKRAGGTERFVWLYGVASTILYAPLIFWRLATLPAPLSARAWGFMAGSGVLNLLYFITLQRGYRVGDLSLVYPLARGTGPLIVMALAAVWLGERPSLLAIGGALLVAAGIFVLTTGGRASGRRGREAVLWGLVTGVLIACYSVWDKYAVSRLDVPPLVLPWASSLAIVLFLTPLAVARWSDVRADWRAHGREALAIAVLFPLAYMLVLAAMTFTPVSYVASAREISILFGALMGARVLKEGDASRRSWAGALMIGGLAALALG